MKHQETKKSKDRQNVTPYIIILEFVTNESGKQEANIIEKGNTVY
jgi:hypothetical protein